MRQIKFRAWDKYRKRFCDWREACAIVSEDNGDLQMRIGIIELNNNDQSSYEFSQFTGLLDKNGKECYESDIIKHSSGRVNVIEWIGNGFWVKGFEDEPFLPANFEIIGNIYESKE